MDVTACLLTRNHASSLERALASVRTITPHILVADTGSTDDTMSIALNSGAKSISVNWNDDFASACNATIEQVTTPWFLWMNPDEELLPMKATLVSEALANANAFAYRLPIHQRYSADSDKTTLSNWEERLIRTTPDVRYIGRVHPQFATSLDQIAIQHGQTVARLEAPIIRYAYLSTPTTDKIRWVVRLLEAELQDRPDRTPVKIELGRNLLWLNDPRGHVLLAEAARDYWPSRNQPHAPDPSVGQLFEYLLTADSAQVHTDWPLKEVRTRVMVWFDRTPPVLWAAAQERYRAGDFAGAVPYLDRLLELGQSGWYDSPGFDLNIVGVAAGMTLGSCYLQLKNWHLARACFEHYCDHPQHGELARRGFTEADAKMRESRSAM